MKRGWLHRLLALHLPAASAIWKVSAISEGALATDGRWSGDGRKVVPPFQKVAAMRRVEA